MLPALGSQFNRLPPVPIAAAHLRVELPMVVKEPPANTVTPCIVRALTEPFGLGFQSVNSPSGSIAAR